jgi:MoCo/4Fe-4S cofactor protein with predicted Tat translocation signal
MSEEHQNGKREEVCPGKKDKLNLVQVSAEKKLDLDQVSADIEQKNGPEFWRSLEELAGSTDFREMMHREFPKGASEWLDTVSRRGFLKLMGSSMALAGMTACTKQPVEPIVPYVRQPEELVPGRPLFYSTAFTLGGYATPLLVTSHMYRPTKVEGNSEHPASEGGSHGQATGNRVIFHVILRRRHEKNFRTHPANHRRQSAQRSQVVKNLQIVGQALMKMRAQNFGSLPRFPRANRACSRRTRRHAPAVATRKRHIMQFEPALAQQ